MPNKETQSILKEEEKKQNASKKKKHERLTENEKYDELQNWLAKPIKIREYEARRAAMQMARIDPSDVMTYERVYCHLMNGIHTPQDFGGIVVITRGMLILREKLENLLGPFHRATQT